MALSFCAIVYPTSELDDRSISHGMAVALAGWDAPKPSLEIVALEGLPGLSVAFYRSGATGTAKASEVDHLRELADDELPFGLSIRDAAKSSTAVVHTLVHSDQIVLDDGARFSDSSMERHFVRDGDEGLEVGVETNEDCEIAPLETDGEDADDLEASLRPHRGSTFLSKELGVPLLPTLVRALYEGGRRVDVRFFGSDSDTVTEETRRLNRVLGRQDGRSRWEVPSELAGIAAPTAYVAFVQTYDWADPTDPSDLYRELSIGNIGGALHFHGPKELIAYQSKTGAPEAHWADAAAAGFYPIAAIGSGSLGGMGARTKTLALGPDADALVIVDGSTVAPAGPTFAELLRYLSLGWKERDDVEEDLIVALMLRAKLRCEGA